MYNAGHRIRMIVSQGSAGGKQLASDTGANWSDHHVYDGETDIIIVSVPDHKLEAVLNTIKCSPGTTVVHTAGSYGCEVFPPSILMKGVFYPLQTFTKGRELNFSEIPFFIESENEKVRSVLSKLAASFGAHTYLSTTDERKRIHLAAVFACNFVNHMLTVASDLSASAGADFRLLKPLVEETTGKAFAAGPENTQTGPAIRNDDNTIERHLAILSENPHLEKIYRDLSDSIKERHK
jgi:predicted short-subunit dehydrogenase-like oxidoreductase (DUF2520 family)